MVKTTKMQHFQDTSRAGPEGPLPEPSGARRSFKKTKKKEERALQSQASFSFSYGTANMVQLIWYSYIATGYIYMCCYVVVGMWRGWGGMFTYPEMVVTMLWGM